MTCLVISQPMFVPWRGLFEQIKLCDVFLFLDDVQLPLGRSLMTRVQIKTARGAEWLSAPVSRSGRALQTIRETEFAGSDWRPRHLSKIKEAYARAPFFAEVWADVVGPMYAFETNSLSAFCTNAVKLISARLGLAPEWHLTSELTMHGADASARLLEFCRAFGAQEYVTGHGAARYLRHSIFDLAGVRVLYMDYRLTPYPQLYGEFMPYVSILDLLFNVGADAEAYLDSQAIPWTDWVTASGGQGPVSGTRIAS